MRQITHKWQGLWYEVSNSGYYSTSTTQGTKESTFFIFMGSWPTYLTGLLLWHAITHSTRAISARLICMAVFPLDKSCSLQFITSTLGWNMMRSVAPRFGFLLLISFRFFCPPYSSKTESSSRRLSSAYDRAWNNNSNTCPRLNDSKLSTLAIFIPYSNRMQKHWCYCPSWLQITEVASANHITLRYWESVVYGVNRRGDRTVPCGPPIWSLYQTVCPLASWTNCGLPIR